MPAKSSPAANLSGYGTFVLAATAGLVVMILAVASRHAWSQEYRSTLLPITEEQVMQSFPETQTSPERYLPRPSAAYQAPAVPPEFIQSTTTSPGLIPRYAAPARHCTTCSGSGGYRNTQIVERATGIPGMRVSEWRSPTTGLTLSEEQRFGVKPHVTLVSGTSCQPCNRTSSRSFESGRPYLNIPDSVW